MVISSLNTPKDYALFHRSLGHSVFPIRNPEEPKIKLDGEDDEAYEKRRLAVLQERKEPDVDSLDIFKETPASEEQIKKWYVEIRNRNFGVFCGKVSNNLIVFDFDGEHSLLKLSWNVINNLQSEVRTAFLNTMAVTTPSGGKHYYFILNDPIIETMGSKTLWSSAEKQHTKIELFGNGHYVVGIGCRGPNNNTYVWNEKRPIPISIKEFEEAIRLLAANPDNILKSILADKTERVVATTSTDLSDGDRTLTTDEMQELLHWVKLCYEPGSRNDIIFPLTGAMRKCGITRESCKDFVKLLCDSTNQSYDDLRRT
jgi:Bifunctional DNA primase/polymerase, N-terminal